MHEKTTAVLLERIQKDLPLTDRPFAEIASRSGTDELEALRILGKLQKDGTIREISAIIDSRRIGFCSAHPGVSHNYHRDHGYNIWFTIAVPPGRDLAKEVETLVRSAENTSYLLLPSLKTYKLRVDLKIRDDGEKRHLSRRQSASGQHKSDRVELCAALFLGQEAAFTARAAASSGFGAVAANSRRIKGRPSTCLHFGVQTEKFRGHPPDFRYTAPSEDRLRRKRDVLLRGSTRKNRLGRGNCGRNRM